MLIDKHKSACPEKARLLAGNQTIGERVKAVRFDLRLSQQDAADKVGISLRAWQKIERDEGVPSGETLMLFEKLDLNPGWILTGLGPRSLSAPAHTNPPPLFNTAVLELIAGLVFRVYRDTGVRLPDGKKVVEAGNLYNELLGRVDDIDDADEVLAMLPWLENRLRKRLDEAKAEPGTGKRSAS